MNKLKRLQRRLAKQGGIALGAIIAAVGLMLLTGGLADREQQKKAAANSKLTQTQAQLGTLHMQLDKSGDAQKRFIAIQLARPSKDFSANSDAMKDLLRAAKDHYRFSDSFKLQLATEKVSDKPEFTGLNYDIVVREPMKLDLEAMSDVHVYSFLTELANIAPGFVRFTRLDIKRKEKMDMTSDVLTQMNGGAMPALVDATIEFSWIGVRPKKATSADASAEGATP